MREDVFDQYPWILISQVAEKGYLDAEVQVRTLGGHSSVPRTFLSLLSSCVFEERKEKSRDPG